MRNPNMPGKKQGRKTDLKVKDRPIKPGSPLYQLLKRIAQEIAKSLETKSSTHNNNESKR